MRRFLVEYYLMFWIDRRGPVEWQVKDQIALKLCTTQHLIPYNKFLEVTYLQMCDVTSQIKKLTFSLKYLAIHPFLSNTSSSFHRNLMFDILINLKFDNLPLNKGEVPDESCYIYCTEEVHNKNLNQVQKLFHLAQMSCNTSCFDYVSSRAYRHKEFLPQLQLLKARST